MLLPGWLERLHAPPLGASDLAQAHVTYFMKLSGTWTTVTAPGCPPDASQAVDPRAGRSGTPCGRGSHRLRGLAPEASARLSSYTLGLYVRPQLVTLQVSFSDLEPPLVDQNRSSQVLLEACLQQLQLLPQLCFIAPRRRNSHVRIAKAQILKRTATAPQGVAMAKRRFSTALPTPEPSLSPPTTSTARCCCAKWLHLGCTSSVEALHRSSISR